jgi:hypothetical protein
MKSNDTSMNAALQWYRRAVWAGILLNLFFAIPALVAPEAFTAMLGLPYLAYYEWMENTGMLILSLNVFYAVAAHNPTRYAAVNWVVVLSRVIAVVFWVYLVATSAYPAAFYPMLATDGTMAVVLGLLLQNGLPAAQKLTWGAVGYALAAPVRGVGEVYRHKPLRYAALATLAFLGVVGYQMYDNLLRARPDVTYPNDADQFKYGAIGLGTTARVPYYLFKVLPEVFKDKLPQNGQPGYRSLGFVYEEGHDLPVGLAQRHIGYKSVEPNCSFCHTGSYRKSPDDKPKVLLGSPSHELDLEAFQWFLYDCAADARFHPDTLMRYIDRIADMSFSERLIYKNAILPFAKSALLKQGKAYAWQKTRPLHGKGRTDTFNPTKDNVFHFPDDQTIGTVDLPQVWNQRPRRDLYLHWDGNNNSLKERNYAAAMAVGATPESVIPAHFTRVTDFLLDLQPPAFPYAVDAPLAAAGQKIYQAECASCHSFGQPMTGQVTELEKIGTDPNRLYSFTAQLVNQFHNYKKEPFKFGAYRKTYGYSNTPLDGIWARAPYLHNGSVPTLWDLLQTPENRPATFYKGYNVYDPAKVGFVTEGAEAARTGFKLDTALPGNGSGGHRYGTGLADGDKKALLEYLKTI